MNIRALNELMKLNGISSYFYLAQKISIPYTTLLDLVKGKGEKLSNIRIIADFFGVNVSYLIEENKKTFYEIDELNKVRIHPFTGYNNMITTLISYNIPLN